MQGCTGHTRATVPFLAPSTLCTSRVNNGMPRATLSSAMPFIFDPDDKRPDQLMETAQGLNSAPRTREHMRGATNDERPPLVLDDFIRSKSLSILMMKQDTVGE